MTNVVLFHVDFYHPSGIVSKFLIQSAWTKSVTEFNTYWCISASHDDRCIKWAFRHWSKMGHTSYNLLPSLPTLHFFFPPSFLNGKYNWASYMFHCTFQKYRNMPEHVQNGNDISGQPMFDQKPLVSKCSIPKKKVDLYSLLANWNKQEAECKNNKQEFCYKRALHLLRKKIQLPLNEHKFRNFCNRLITSLNCKKKQNVLFKWAAHLKQPQEHLHSHFSAWQGYMHELRQSQRRMKMQSERKMMCWHHFAKCLLRNRSEDKQAQSDESDGESVNTFGPFILHLLARNFARDFLKQELKNTLEILESKIKLLSTLKDRQEYDHFLKKYNQLHEALNDSSIPTFSKSYLFRPKQKQKVSRQASPITFRHLTDKHVNVNKQPACSDEYLICLAHLLVSLMMMMMYNTTIEMKM